MLPGAAGSKQVGVGLLQADEHARRDVLPPALTLETVVNRFRQNDEHQDYNGDKDGTHGNLHAGLQARRKTNRNMACQPYRKESESTAAPDLHVERVRYPQPASMSRSAWRFRSQKVAQCSALRLPRRGPEMAKQANPRASRPAQSANPAAAGARFLPARWR